MLASTHITPSDLHGLINFAQWALFGIGVGAIGLALGWWKHND